MPIGNAVNKGLTLRMNQASVKRHLPRLIDHIQAGRIEARRIITHRTSHDATATQVGTSCASASGCAGDPAGK